MLKIGDIAPLNSRPHVRKIYKTLVMFTFNNMRPRHANLNVRPPLLITLSRWFEHRENRGKDGGGTFSYVSYPLSSCFFFASLSVSERLKQALFYSSDVRRAIPDIFPEDCLWNNYLLLIILTSWQTSAVTSVNLPNCSILFTTGGGTCGRVSAWSSDDSQRGHWIVTTEVHSKRGTRNNTKIYEAGKDF